MNTKRRIIETKAFSKEIADLIAKNSLLQDDYDLLKKELAENPEKGGPSYRNRRCKKSKIKIVVEGKKRRLSGMLFLLCFWRGGLSSVGFSEK